MIANAGSSIHNNTGRVFFIKIVSWICLMKAISLNGEGIRWGIILFFRRPTFNSTHQAVIQVSSKVFDDHSSEADQSLFHGA